jgi:hypothetical protein
MGYDLIINVAQLSLMMGIMGVVTKIAYDSGKMKQEVADLKEIVFNWFKPKTKNGN